MTQTISSALAWWARMRGDQAAVVLAGESLTYAEYKDWSDRVAAMLISNGVRPGDRVGVCSANSLAYVALIMGTIRAGAIVSPVNFRYTSREIAELCETTEPKLSFAAPDQSEKMANAGFTPLAMAEIEALRFGTPTHVEHDPDPDAPVVIIATSGSTAKPKGVVFTNRSMTAYAANWAVEETSTAPDPKFGETPFVVYHGPVEIDVTALISYCDANLSNYKVPRYVAYSADPLPRLATGKLSKPAVREIYAGAHERLTRVR